MNPPVVRVSAFFSNERGLLMATNIFSTTLTNGDDHVSIKGLDVDIPWTVYALAGDDTVTLTGGWQTRCYMGDGNDVVINNGADYAIVHGEAGNDRLDLHFGSGSMDGGDGSDVANVYGGINLAFDGGAGNDRVNFFSNVNASGLGGDGADGFYGYGHAVTGTIDGGNDNDRFYGFTGSNVTLAGASGNDVYRVDSSSAPTILENAGEGIDTVVATVSYTLGDNVERLTLTGSAAIDGTGNALANVIRGNGAANSLSGGDGNDKLLAGPGTDQVHGDAGNDWIEGGPSSDEMWGGGGADVFTFRPGDFGGNTASSADLIHDFSIAEHDRLRLDYIDANTGLAGDQAFAFIGANAFHNVAGELRYEQITGNTYVEGDVNGDGVADFMIALDGLKALTGNNLIL
jgi:Ca2+-binding RTX toxin-like protein